MMLKIFSATEIPKKVLVGKFRPKMTSLDLISTTENKLLDPTPHSLSLQLVGKSNQWYEDSV